MNLLNIDGRVHIIHILLIQLFPQQLHGFSETLEVYNLPLPQEFDYIIHIGIITQPQNIIVSYPCFLFCCYHK